jgi:DNA-binding NarL/FixJ family response regulator
MPFLVPLLARARESAGAALGAAKFQAAFEAGQRLDRDAGLRLALGGPAGDGPAGAPAPRGAGAGPLATREADVARLVADGLTNKQIGARLFISERTVDSHVRSILNKLGVGSRAQIAAWVATLGE